MDHQPHTANSNHATALKWSGWSCPAETGWGPAPQSSGHTSGDDALSSSALLSCPWPCPLPWMLWQHCCDARRLLLPRNMAGAGVDPSTKDFLAGRAPLSGRAPVWLAAAQTPAGGQQLQLKGLALSDRAPWGVPSPWAGSGLLMGSLDAMLGPRPGQPASPASHEDSSALLSHLLCSIQWWWASSEPAGIDSEEGGSGQTWVPQRCTRTYLVAVTPMEDGWSRPTTTFTELRTEPGVPVHAVVTMEGITWPYLIAREFLF